MKARRRRAGLALAAFLVVPMACSDEPSRQSSTNTVQGTVLAVDDLPAAVGAVEAARGGPQEYVELNVTPDGVNVFVAVNQTDEVAYFFTGEGLEAPGAPQPQTSAPFPLDGIDLTLAPDLVQQTQDRFPGATVTEVVLLQMPGQGVRWGLRSRSPRGGVLDVLYSVNGDLVSVAPTG